MTKNDFFSHWLKTFAGNISKEDLERYVISTGNLLWHVFSWNLLTEDCYLVGENARSAYQKADKSAAIYIEWFADGALKICHKQCIMQTPLILCTKYM